jgi:uncharacterized protein YkwD
MQLKPFTYWFREMGYLSRHPILALFFLSSFAPFTLPGYSKDNLQGRPSAHNANKQSFDQLQSNESIQTVYQKVNAYRVSHHLQPLTLNPLISNLARTHSREMANGEATFGHGGFERRAQILMQKFSYREISENVGYNMGYANPASEVVEGWLHSPEHLKNIKGDFELTGIGVARNKKGKYYFTQIFLKR